MCERIFCAYATNVFRTVISIGADGEPVIGWEPKLSAAEEAKRTYTIEDRSSLTEGDWNELRIENGEWRIGEYRFFRVKVDVK